MLTYIHSIERVISNSFFIIYLCIYFCKRLITVQGRFQSFGGLFLIYFLHDLSDYSYQEKMCNSFSLYNRSRSHARAKLPTRTCLSRLNFTLS